MWRGPVEGGVSSEVATIVVPSASAVQSRQCLTDWLLLLLVLAPEHLLFFLLESVTFSVFYKPNKTKECRGFCKLLGTSGRGPLAFGMEGSLDSELQLTARLCPVLCGTWMLKCVCRYGPG